MALKTKAHVPQDAVETVNEEPTQEQISFDDLEFEAEYVDEEQLETKKFYTISGKEQQYEPSWDKMNVRELDVGDEFEGTPEITLFENDDKSYNSARVRLLDDGEILDCYFNFPKKDFPYVTGINKGFDFYRTCFDFIYSVLKFRDERNVVNGDGEEINRFKKVNLETFLKYVDGMTRIGVIVTEGNPDSEYDSWQIKTME